MPPSPPGPGRARPAVLALDLPCEVELPSEAGLPTEAVPREDELAELVSGLGPGIRRGGGVEEPRLYCPTGLPQVDRLLGGGFSRGHLSEVAGPPSSGRTSLALSLLAATTSEGELAAVVDGADAFDPLSAESAGVDLDRILWARVPWEPPRPSTPRLQAGSAAFLCTERLLQTEGFPLVLLDLDSRARRWLDRPQHWIRLARMAAATRTALVVLSTERLAGPRAEVAIELRSSRVDFSAPPKLLETLEARAMLVRHRTAPVDRSAELELVAAEASAVATVDEALRRGPQLATSPPPGRSRQSSAA